MLREKEGEGGSGNGVVDVGNRDHILSLPSSASQAAAKPGCSSRGVEGYVKFSLAHTLRMNLEPDPTRQVLFNCSLCVYCSLLVHPLPPLSPSLFVHMYFKNHMKPHGMLYIHGSLFRFQVEFIHTHTFLLYCT